MALASALPTAATLVGLAAASPAGAAEIGKAAPAFEAHSSAGRVALADFLGRKNVLPAYSFGDFTGG